MISKDGFTEDMLIALSCIEDCPILKTVLYWRLFRMEDLLVALSHIG